MFQNKVICRNRRADQYKKDIAHSLPMELLTPITSILGCSDILVNDIDSLDKELIHELSKDIKSSSERLNEIIKRVIDYNQLDLILNDPDKILELRKYSREINFIICDTALRAADKYGRAVDLKLRIDNLTLSVNEIHLRKIITELVDNASKFSPWGSSIEVIGTASEDEYSIFVIDSGKGMSTDEINSISEFVQFNKKRSEPVGAGLGLCIIKKILSIYDGKMILDSIPGIQTIARVNLPLL